MKNHRKQAGKIETKINFVSRVKFLTVKIPCGESHKPPLPYHT